MDTKKIRAAFDTFVDSKVVPLNANAKAGIAAGILILPIVLFYFLYYSPNSDQISQLTGNVKQLQTELNDIKAKAAKLDEHKAEMAKLETNFKEAALLIPDQKEIPSLLDSISGLGSSAGLDILAFVPGTEAAKDFYAEIPVSLSVIGTYHNVGYFLDTVSKLPRIVNVNKVTMGSPKLVDGQMIVDAKLDLVTYKFLPSPAGSDASNAPKNAKK